MGEISLNRLFASGEPGDYALNVKRRWNVACKDVELGVFFGYDAFESVRQCTDFQCFDELFHDMDVIGLSSWYVLLQN